MSCGISDRTIAVNTAAGTAVSTIAKYRKPNTPVAAAPIIYIFLRPMRSEMWPDSGMDERDAGCGENRRQNEVPRHVQGADRIGEDERGEDVERRLLRHPQQGGQDDLPGLLADDLDDRGLLDP